MKPLWLLPAAAVLLLARTGRRAPPSGPACPTGSLSLIGDSLAVGLAPHLRELARGCELPWDASPFVGAHVTEWTGPRLSTALSRRPHVVLVSLGGNDFQRADTEHVRAAVALLAERVRGAGARLVWIGPPTMPFADAAGVREMWRAVVPAADRWDLEGAAIARAPDEIHPTASEYERLAGELWRWLS